MTYAVAEASCARIPHKKTDCMMAAVMDVNPQTFNKTELWLNVEFCLGNCEHVQHEKNRSAANKCGSSVKASLYCGCTVSKNNNNNINNNNNNKVTLPLTARFSRGQRSVGFSRAAALPFLLLVCEVIRTSLSQRGWAMST